MICMFDKEKRRASLSAADGPQQHQDPPKFTSSAVKTFFAFLVPYLGLMYFSFVFTQGWQFLDQTYGFMYVLFIVCWFKKKKVKGKGKGYVYNLSGFVFLFQIECT
jgi:hypothetical protein